MSFASHKPELCDCHKHKVGYFRCEVASKHKWQVLQEK
jgi:hypothetical protein